MGLWQWTRIRHGTGQYNPLKTFSRNSGYCRFHRRDDVEVMGESIVATMTASG
jgi:hypothetical protein